MSLLSQGHGKHSLHEMSDVLMLHHTLHRMETWAGLCFVAETQTCSRILHFFKRHMGYVLSILTSHGGRRGGAWIPVSMHVWHTQDMMCTEGTCNACDSFQAPIPGRTRSVWAGRELLDPWDDGSAYSGAVVGPQRLVGC
jgi:hypothetical protein